MSIYAKYVLPRFIDLAMRNKETARLRAAWIPQACGEVLEVGIGSGLNLPFYSSQVQRVFGVDPSVEVQRIARGRALTGSLNVEFLLQSAEHQLPLSNACIDTAVLTWTLCSIADPSKALREVKRVLKPDGRLIFLEHGRSPDSHVVAWQDRLTPVWKCIGGGCHLNRIETDIDVGMTFLRVDTTELGMGNPARADDLLTKARLAYATAASFLPGVTEAEEWQHLHDEHQALADAIREVERRKRRQEGEKPPRDA